MHLATSDSLFPFSFFYELTAAMPSTSSGLKHNSLSKRVFFFPARRPKSRTCSTQLDCCGCNHYRQRRWIEFFSFVFLLSPCTAQMRIDGSRQQPATLPYSLCQPNSWHPHDHPDEMCSLPLSSPYVTSIWRSTLLRRQMMRGSTVW